MLHLEQRAAGRSGHVGLLGDAAGGFLQLRLQKLRPVTIHLLVLHLRFPQVYILLIFCVGIYQKQGVPDGWKPGASILSPVYIPRTDGVYFKGQISLAKKVHFVPSE